MQVYGDASLDTPNRSQTHSQALPLIQCIKCDAHFDASLDAPLDARCVYTLRVYCVCRTEQGSIAVGCVPPVC